MALETLEGTTEIDGFKIIRHKPESMSWDDFDKLRDEFPINITERMNTISFRLQNGPIKEVGVNGCQVDTLVAAAIIIISELNDKFPCDENRKAIGHLKDGFYWLKARKSNREKRGVEGENKL